MIFDSFIDDLKNDIRKASDEVFVCYANKVRNENPLGPGGLPYQTGLLQKGLQLGARSSSNGLETRVFESTTKSRGFDYPAFLDINARGIHTGWWRTVNREQFLEDCTNQIFPKYNL